MVPFRNRDIDRIEVLGKYSHLSIEQIEFETVATCATVRTIDRGIFILVAFWSAFALRGFAALTRELNRLELGQIRIVAADVDGADDLRQLPEIGNSLMNGDGKTLWIRDGKIIGTSIPIDGQWNRLELIQRLLELHAGHG